MLRDKQTVLYQSLGLVALSMTARTIGATIVQGVLLSLLIHFWLKHSDKPQNGRYIRKANASIIRALTFGYIMRLQAYANQSAAAN